MPLPASLPFFHLLLPPALSPGFQLPRCGHGLPPMLYGGDVITQSTLPGASVGSTSRQSALISRIRPSPLVQVGQVTPAPPPPSSPPSSTRPRRTRSARPPASRPKRAAG